MNRPLLCTIVSLSMLGLAACASPHGGAGYGAAPAGSQPAQAFERDMAYIAYVERTARMRGLDVRWVNPPLKRVARSDDSEAQ
ncbi:hypothetical protein [Luteimonas sp. R10]|uniref:hypothetical protein n=1 Tax=Luteimonas sp. R10 TaxID=3108176 RepID=UPI00308F8007|nr:hypothetical protein U3649_09415 [Luteimonas sp. R10]